MGTSPQEERAAQLSSTADMYASGRAGGQMAMSRYNQHLAPLFQQGQSMIDTGAQRISDTLNTSLSSRIAGVGQTVGESLVTQGVAPGHAAGSSFAAYLAPAIAETQSAQAEMGTATLGMKANLLSQQGASLLDLFRQDDATLAAMLGISSDAVKQMKDSTVIGDIVGTLNTLAQIGKGANEIFS